MNLPPQSNLVSHSNTMVAISTLKWTMKHQGVWSKYPASICQSSSIQKFPMYFPKILQNDAITSMWNSTSYSMNLQYDSYKNTKHVLQAVHQEHKEN